MKAIQTWIASGLLIVFVATGGGALGDIEEGDTEGDDTYWTLEDYLANHEQFAGIDWDQAESQTHTLLVPVGMSIAVTKDWISGDVTFGLLPDPLTFQQLGAAGCVSDYSVQTIAPWAIPGMATNQQCTSTQISGPLSATTHITDTDGSSSMTSASYRPTPFDIHSVLLVCENTAVESVMWPDALVEQHCTIMQFGSLNPSEWAHYSGNCGLSFGATEGTTACVHRS